MGNLNKISPLMFSLAAAVVLFSEPATAAEQNLEQSNTKVQVADQLSGKLEQNRSRFAEQTAEKLPPVVIDVSAGSKIPSKIDLVVGQQLLFKGSGLGNALTLRHQDITMYRTPQLKESLNSEQVKGYKAAFTAVTPGQAKVGIDWNTMFYGMFPWGSRTISVNVEPAESLVAQDGKAETQH